MLPFLLNTLAGSFLGLLKSDLHLAVHFDKYLYAVPEALL